MICLACNIVKDATVCPYCRQKMTDAKTADAHIKKAVGHMPDSRRFYWNERTTFGYNGPCEADLRPSVPTEFRELPTKRRLRTSHKGTHVTSRG